MKLNHHIIWFILLILPGCKKSGIQGPVIQKISIENIETHSNYYAPIELYSDIEIGQDNYTFILNGEEIQLTNPYIIEDAGFYSLITQYPPNTFDDDTILFVVLDNERGEAEWGLKKWTPVLPVCSILNTERVEAAYPPMVINGISVPVIFRVIEGDSIKKINLHLTDTDNQTSYLIKNGILALNRTNPDLTDELNFSVQNNIINLKLKYFEGIPAEPENYLINGQYVIDSGKVILLKYDLTVENNSTLVILPGSIIIIDEGVNIHNMGKITIRGTSDKPVLITCSNPDKYWGGIISDNNSETEVNNCFISRSGFHDTPEYQYGHAKRQALLYLDDCRLSMKNSYIVDNIGQIFYSNNADIFLDSIIVSGAKTGGQINYSNIDVSNSFFTDFPDFSQSYQDEDNDCLYLNASDATISNTVFMYARDDGIDSGADAGGEVYISDCIFEGMFHEGIAMSSANDVLKNHYIINCTFTNCGQGIEMGYSSPNHSAYVDHCLLEYNLIGIRYGDNYPWPVQGNLFINNTASIYNLDKDVWNMVRSRWSPFTEKMHFENTTVSESVPDYPGLLTLSK